MIRVGISCLGRSAPHQDSGLSVPGSGIRVQRVECCRFRVSGSAPFRRNCIPFSGGWCPPPSASYFMFWFWCFGFDIPRLIFRVLGCVFRITCFIFHVSYFIFRVQRSTPVDTAIPSQVDSAPSPPRLHISCFGFHDSCFILQVSYFVIHISVFILHISSRVSCFVFRVAYFIFHISYFIFRV